MTKADIGQLQAFLGLVVCFAQTTKPNQIEYAVGPCVSQVGNGTMQIIRECRMRAAILTAIAKEAPELEDQLLYVARKWLTLAALREQLRSYYGFAGTLSRHRRMSAIGITADKYERRP